MVWGWLWQHRKQLIAALAALAPIAAIAALIVVTALAGGVNSPAAEAALQDPGCRQQLQAQGVDPSKGINFGVGPTANGRAIIAAGIEMRIPEKGIIVGLATAMQESGMRVLANPKVPESMSLPHEGIGTDHLSVGPFQQQPWWGSTAELMAPRTSARKFFAALLKVGGWQSMAPTVAAQSVQQSAFPDAYADDVAAATLFYRKHLPAVLSASGGSAPTPTQSDGANLCEQVKPRSERTTMVLSKLPAGKASEKGLQRYTILTNRAVSAAFPQIQSIGGVRSDSLKWHPQGLALDAMIPNPLTPAGISLGNGVRDFVLRNAKALGIDHAIWRQRMWYPDGSSEGMEDRGGLTNNHFDHVHIATKGGGYP